MTEQWLQEYQQIFEVDEAYEMLVSAWMAYHEAADAVDGHYGRNIPADVRHAAVKAGFAAMDRILPGYRGYHSKDVRWNAAKTDALRRLDHAKK